MKFFTLLYFVVSSVAFSHVAHSEVTEHAEGMPIKLGQPWDPFNPTFSYIATGCFQDQIDDGQVPGVEIDTKSDFIESFREFKQVTRLGIKAAGSFNSGVTKVSAAAEYSKLVLGSDARRTVTWYFQGKRDYQPKFTTLPILSDIGIRRLEEAEASGDFTQFSALCGPSLVTSISKESRISVVYSLTVSDTRLLTRVKQAITASFNSTSGSGTVSGDFFKQVQSIDQSIEIRWRAFQTGVSGTAGSASVEDLISVSPGNLAEVRSAIKSALDALDYADSPISKFVYQDTLTTIGKGSNSRLTLFPIFIRRVGRIERVRDEVELDIVRLDNLLTQSKNGEIKLKEGSKKILEDAIVRLEDSDVLMAVQVKRCLSAEDVGECAIATRPVSISTAELVEGEFAIPQGWNAQAGGGYTGHGERVNSHSEFWPVVRFRNVPLIRYAFFERANSENKLLKGGDIPGQVGKGVTQSKLLQFGLGTDELRPYLSQRHTNTVYCWAGIWSDCVAWASDRKRHARELKARENSFEYTLVVVDLDGNEHRFSLGNADSDWLGTY